MFKIINWNEYFSKLIPNISQCERLHSIFRAYRVSAEPTL